MNLVWEHILPALQSDGAAAEQGGGGVAAAASSRACRCRPQAGEATRPLAAQVSGKRYVFPANDAKLESVAVEFGADGAVIAGAPGRSRQPRALRPRRVAARRHLLTIAGTRRRREKIAGSGAWTADDTFTVKLAAYETPFVQTLAFQWKGDELLARHGVQRRLRRAQASAAGREAGREVAASRARPGRRASRSRAAAGRAPRARAARARSCPSAVTNGGIGPVFATPASSSAACSTRAGPQASRRSSSGRNCARSAFGRAPVGARARGEERARERRARGSRSRS